MNGAFSRPFKLTNPFRIG